ncbi:hypothetical protein HCH54_000643 [Aspergillus fumigatus]
MPSVPDAEIYPEASGPAKALVDRHQAEQPLKLHAGWFFPTLACPTGQSDGNDLKLKSFILEYYEEAYPDHQRRLLPGDPYEKARAKVWMDFVTTWVIPASIASCRVSGPSEGVDQRDASWGTNFSWGIGFQCLIWCWALGPCTCGCLMSSR